MPASAEWLAKPLARGEQHRQLPTIRNFGDKGPMADNLGVVRALKTGSREAWHIGFRCDVTFTVTG